MRAPLLPLALGVVLGALPPWPWGVALGVGLALASRGRIALLLPALAVCLGGAGVFWGARWAAQQPVLEGVRQSAVVRAVELTGETPRLRLEPDAAPGYLLRLSVPRLPAGLGVGARVEVRLTAPPRRPSPADADGLFDAQAWSTTRRLGWTARGHARVLEPADSVSLAWLALRRGAHAALDRAPNVQGAQVLRGLLLGDQSGLDDAVVRAFETTGTGHLLSVSGLHISGLAWVVFVAVRRLAAKLGALEPSRAAALCAFPVAWLFVGLSEWPLAAVRSGVMTGGMLLGHVVRRRAEPLNLLGLAALTVLWPDPTVAREPSFGLSFGAVLTLIVLAEGQGPVSWVRASLAASAATAPLQAGFFGTLSPAAPWANLLLVPVASGVLVPAGMLALALAPLSPAPLAWTCEATAFFTALVEETGALAGPVWVVGAHAAWGLAAPLVLWAGARAGLPRAAVAISAALGVATVVVRPPAVLVEFLPVGQGDAIIVKCGAHAALIDAGPDPEARVVRARLRLLGVDALDAVVATHAHPDHTGGLAATLRWFDVARVFAPADAHAALVRATWGARTRAPLSDPGALSLPLGPTCALRFLPHDPPLRAEPNDTSLVARLDWPGGRALFTGDIEADAEVRLVAHHGADLRADVLKAPHHGSTTSSTPTLLRAVSPRAVVFTTGVKNPWGFPREGIVDRYARRGVAWLDTARHGSVRLDADAEGAWLTPHRGPRVRVGGSSGTLQRPP